MAFDSNQAWKDASTAVTANRDVLAALGGVFFALPAFALTLFMPPPESPQGVDGKAAFALLGDYYRHAWPALLVISILSMLGSLTILTLFSDRTRPTVGEAMRRGARAILPLLGAQLLLGLAAGGMMLLILAIGGASGNALLSALLVVAFGIGLVFVMVRFALISPVIVAEGQRSPVQALRRSWALTGGSMWHLIAFFVLLVIVMLLLYLLIAKGIGLVVALITSGAVTRTINDLVAACLQAVLSVYSVAVLAATHRQLAGPSTATLAERFE